MTFVQLPSDVQLAIQALAVALVAVAVNWLIVAVPWLAFLQAYALEWGMLVAALLIDFIQNALPTGSDDVSIKAIIFILALIGMFVKFLKARQVNGFAETK
jgi:hypothetical protein